MSDPAKIPAFTCKFDPEFNAEMQAAIKEVLDLERVEKGAFKFWIMEAVKAYNADARKLPEKKRMVLQWKYQSWRAKQFRPKTRNGRPLIGRSAASASVTGSAAA